MLRTVNYEEYLEFGDTCSGFVHTKEEELHNLGVYEIKSKLLSLGEDKLVIAGFSLATWVLPDWSIIADSCISDLVGKPVDIIDIVVADELRNQGWATELVRYIVSNTDKPLMWNTSVTNKPSNLLAKRFGFKYFTKTPEHLHYIRRNNWPR